MCVDGRIHRGLGAVLLCGTFASNLSSGVAIGAEFDNNVARGT